MQKQYQFECFMEFDMRKIWNLISFDGKILFNRSTFYGHFKTNWARELGFVLNWDQFQVVHRFFITEPIFEKKYL